MKNIKYISVFILFFGLFSCEDVVEVDLPTAEPRLVVDASLNWFKGEQGSFQRIKLTTTTAFYNNEVPVVSGAVVSVENQDGVVFDFIENGTSGEYLCYDFVPELGKTYTLNLVINGEFYTATETFTAVPEILYTEQKIIDGFGDDVIEIKYFFQDEPNEDNFYVNVVSIPSKSYLFYGTLDDEFFQGNVMYGIFISDEIQAGDEVNINLYGVSQRYYNYMNKILEVSNNGGGPFQTNTGTVRGNLINQTNPDNFALGYFRLSEVSVTNYVVE